MLPRHVLAVLQIALNAQKMLNVILAKMDIVMILEQLNLAKLAHLEIV